MSRRSLLGYLTLPLERFYPTAKALYIWRMRRAMRRYPHGPLLLLQMGKVGSKSVQAGLEATVSDRPIYHAHFLSRERTAETEVQRREFFRTDRHTYLMRPWLNQFLRQQWESGAQTDWKIVTLTREPIGRNISAFFENLDVVSTGEDRWQISSHYYGIEPTTVTLADTQRLAALFYERATHDSAPMFFDREIRDIFGIDVIGSGFANDVGYQIYRQGSAELLVLRLEDLDRTAAPAMRDFLGLEDFRLINTNIGAEKIYAPLYRAFKREIGIDPDYAERLLDSDYMKTFYNSREIERVRDRWVRQPGPAMSQPVA